MSQMTKYLIGLILALILALIVLARINQSNVREKDRLSENQDAMLSSVKYYKTRDSLSAASVQRLTLTNQELKKHHSLLMGTILDLDIKVTRVKTASTTSVKSHNKIQVIVRDSIRTVKEKEETQELKTDTLRCIDYSDQWLTISGCQEENEFTGIIECRTTIDQVVHRVPRKFLFFRWGTKAIRQEVVSRNPNSVITFTEYIELKK